MLLLCLDHWPNEWICCHACDQFRPVANVILRSVVVQQLTSTRGPRAIMLFRMPCLRQGMSNVTMSNCTMQPVKHMHVCVACLRCMANFATLLIVVLLHYRSVARLLYWYYNGTGACHVVDRTDQPTVSWRVMLRAFLHCTVASQSG